MASGASNSDVQYVAYLKAKFNLADADLLHVISLSQKPEAHELPAAPEGEEGDEILEIVEESEEEEKVEVDPMDTSAYEEVIDDESYEEVEEVEYVEADTPSPAPAPIPMFPDSGPQPDMSPEEPAAQDSPASQFDYSVPTPIPEDEILADSGTAAERQAIVPVPDAPTDEITENEYQIVERVEEDEPAPAVRFPDDIEPSPRAEPMSSVKESMAMVEPEGSPFQASGSFEDKPADSTDLAIVPYKKSEDALVPVPEQAPPIDEEEGGAAKNPTEVEEGEEADESTQRLVIGLGVLLLIAIIVVIILIFIPGGIPRWWEDDSGPVTMEPYVKDNCNFEGQAQPNVINQCECNGRVNEINSWTQEQYDRLVRDFIPTIYTSWSLTSSSCEPANQALLWLSTGKVIEDQTTLKNRYVSAVFYFSTEGQQWRTQTDWMSEQDVCTWYGLTCAGLDISKMELANNRLDGLIATELGELTRLDTIALDRNNLGDAIPSDVFAIPSLTRLTLGTNNLVGTIPTQIGQAVLLEDLRLNGNRLGGSLPTQLNGLTRLSSLSLADNTMITGRIPSEIGLFRNLRTLTLSSTDIRAVLPSEYGQLTRLQEIRIANTLVGGVIPTQFGELTALRIVDFAGSRFRQTIPSVIGLLTALSTLMLGNNELTGTIPPEFGSLTQLQQLDLHANVLSGLVPGELANLRSLTDLTIQGNPLVTGRMPDEICMLSPPEGNLKSFVVDCPTRQFGVICPIESCCSECIKLSVEQP